MGSNNEETRQNHTEESLIIHNSESKISLKSEAETTKKSEINSDRSPSLEGCSIDENTVNENSEHTSKENLERCAIPTTSQNDPNSLDISEFFLCNSKITELNVPPTTKEISILDSSDPERMIYKDEVKTIEDDGLSFRNLIKKISHLFFSTLSSTSKEKELNEMEKQELKNNFLMHDDKNTKENPKFKISPVIITYPQSQKPKQPFMNTLNSRNNPSQRVPNPPSYYTSALNNERLQMQREQYLQRQQQMEQQSPSPQTQPQSQSQTQEFSPTLTQPQPHSIKFFPSPSEEPSPARQSSPTRIFSKTKQSTSAKQTSPARHSLVPQKVTQSECPDLKNKSCPMLPPQTSQRQDATFAPNVYDSDQVVMTPNTLLNISFWAPYPESIPPNVPPCLAHLVAADSLFIIQKLDMIELFMDMVEPNYFLIQNEAGQCLYYVYESTGMTLCCDNCRAFQLHVMDMYHNEIIYINKPCGCNNCFCCYPVLEVYSPPMVPVGAVTQKINPKRIEFAVLDADENLIFKIYGPCCCLTFGETDFTIHALDWEKTEVGYIRRQWGGYVKTFFTNTDYYGITFPVDMDVRLKAVFLGALFLIDYSFYDHRVPVIF